MTAYYNEHDPRAAAWLRELIKEGHIAHGVVDERSIEDIRPLELAGFTQCHFFAGIGGWSHALRVAGWPDDRAVWTGSCPCQPFSAAGKGAGFDDERHLWPAWFQLIAQCRPGVVYGEQVASKDGLAWLDVVHSDLEAAGYAVGAQDLCAAGVGAPHIRQRLYFVADACRKGLERRHVGAMGRELPAAERGCSIGGVADSNSPRLRPGQWDLPAAGHGNPTAATSGHDQHGCLGPTNGHWGAADWVLCRDGDWRPVEPGTFPLAHGVPGRVGLLRGYGNAIVPQVAAAFIGAYLDTRIGAE